MNKILVLYYSRTGNTEKMARAVTEGARSSGKFHVDFLYFISTDDLVNYSALLMGAPTYHHNVPVDMKMLFEEASAKNVSLKGKVGATFGSYGWSGEAPNLLQEIMKNKFDMDLIEPPLLAKYVPDFNSLEKCRTLGKLVAEKLIQMV